MHFKERRILQRITVKSSEVSYPPLFKLYCPSERTTSERNYRKFANYAERSSSRVFIAVYQWKVISFNSFTTDKSTTKCSLLFQALNANFCRH